MLLKPLTKYQPANLIVYILLGVGLWMRTLTNNNIPGIFIDSDPTPVYSWIVQLLDHQNLVLFCKILALVLILFQGLLFNGIINQYNLLATRSYLPGIIYLLVIANFPDNQILHAVFFSTLLVILSWNLMINADFAQSSMASYFNSSVLLGLSTLLYPNYIYFVIILFASTFSNRVPKIREFAMIFTGILLVWYFYFSLFFIFTGKLEISGLEFKIHFSVKDLHKLKTSQILFFVYFSILTIISGLQASRALANQKIQTRRNFKILFLWILLATLIFFLTSTEYEIIYLVAIPVSSVVAMFFSDLRYKWLKEIAFMLLLIITMINQFFIHFIP